MTRAGGIVLVRATALLSVLALCSEAARAEGSGGVNAAAHRDKPYVVLVSIDGFRWDYPLRFDTPALDRLAARGVRAFSLKPVFPTLTFPNHYSIATGLYPARHGIVDNSFFDEERKAFFTLRDRAAVEDGAWYGGNPLWVVAEKAGMVTAAYFFVGTEADIGGVRPTYWYPFDDSIAGSQRVEQVLEWLALPEERRPHLITLYFEDVDEASHEHGIGALPMVTAISQVDGLLERLASGIDALPIAGRVYVIVVSDHGQAEFRRGEAPFIVEQAVSLDGVRAVDHGALVALYFAEPDRARARAMRNQINRSWERGQAIVPGEAPESWHVTPGSRFADVLVQADARATVHSTRGGATKRAGHGWAPDIREMHGIFVAAGPRLPAGERIDTVEAIDIYPLILAILGLEAPAPVDGDPDALVPLLAP